MDDSPMAHAPRLSRELKTITAMVKIYCSNQHQNNKTSSVICNNCRAFLDYAEKRLSYCPFQEQKPTCGKCTIHCYKQDRKEQAKIIMRYAGPRMLTRHPIMALRHLLDSRKVAPELQCRSKNCKNEQSHQLSDKP